MCVCSQIVHATPYCPPKRHTPLKCRDSHHLPLPTPNIFKTLPECSRNEKYNNPACQHCKHVRSTKFAHATRLLNFTSLELHGGIITSLFHPENTLHAYKRAPVEFSYRFYQQIVSDPGVFRTSTGGLADHL